MSTTMDELIDDYAAILQTIYDAQTAGDYTFVGVLGAMVRQMQEANMLATAPPIVPPADPAPYVLPGHGPGVR